MDSRASSIIVRDLGRMAYGPALAEQRCVHEQVLTGQTGETLLFVEHDPVITISRRMGAGDNLLATPEKLSELGIDTHGTDRGGDITYHGPGQLVAYPIIRLADHGLNVGRYMRLLERAIIDTLDAFGVKGQRIDGWTGVWVEGCRNSDHSGIRNPESERSITPSKIAALGVRVKRNVTMHGLAINVSTDLSHFETIIPCGLENRNVTSMKELLDEQCPEMGEVKESLHHQLQRLLCESND